MGKVMEELLHDRLVERDARSRNEGRTSAFAELVRDGVMSLSEAAKRAGLSEAAFKKIAML